MNATRPRIRAGARRAARGARRAPCPRACPRGSARRRARRAARGTRTSCADGPPAGRACSSRTRTGSRRRATARTSPSGAGRAGTPSTPRGRAAARAAMLYEVSAPKRSVSGEKSSASAGTLVVHVRFSPSGAQIACVTNGFSPCRIACGHQAKSQTKMCGIGAGADVGLAARAQGDAQPEDQEGGEGVHAEGDGAARPAAHRAGMEPARTHRRPSYGSAWTGSAVGRRDRSGARNRDGEGRVVVLGPDVARARGDRGGQLVVAGRRRLHLEADRAWSRRRAGSRAGR